MANQKSLSITRQCLVLSPIPVAILLSFIFSSSLPFTNALSQQNNHEAGITILNTVMRMQAEMIVGLLGCSVDRLAHIIHPRPSFPGYYSICSVRP